MARIFISYRRSDSQADAGRLFESLSRTYGESAIFKDVDNIAYGEDFRASILNAIARSDVFLLVIGPGWLERDAAGRARLTRSSDPVRLELESARSAGVPIVPVRVRGGEMPDQEELPEALAWLSFVNAAEVEHHSWGRDIQNLVDHLETLIARRTDVRARAVLVDAMSGGSRPYAEIEAAAADHGVDIEQILEAAVESGLHSVEHGGEVLWVTRPRRGSQPVRMPEAAGGGTTGGTGATAPPPHGTVVGSPPIGAHDRTASPGAGPPGAPVVSSTPPSMPPATHGPRVGGSAPTTPQPSPSSRRPPPSDPRSRDRLGLISLIAAPVGAVAALITVWALPAITPSEGFDSDLWTLRDAAGTSFTSLYIWMIAAAGLAVIGFVGTVATRNDTRGTNRQLVFQIGLVVAGLVALTVPVRTLNEISKFNGAISADTSSNFESLSAGAGVYVGFVCAVLIAGAGVLGIVRIVQARSRAPGG